MNEKPKSIWKKSWKGPRAVLLRTTVFLIAIWLGMFLIMLISDWTAKTAFVVFLAIGGLTMLSALLFLVYPIISSWKTFRRFLFTIACLATLVALFYAEEDWRGWHAWNQFKHQWEAKGEKFDWRSIVPPPVPDDQNFAFSPVWIAEIRNTLGAKRAEAWYGNRIYREDVSKLLPLVPVSQSGLVGTNWWSSHLPNEPDWPGNWATAHIPDLKPWQAYYRGVETTNPAAGIPITPQPQSPAADVLLALSKSDPVIEQMRQDSARPYSRFPVGYDDENKGMILLPHLSAVKRYSLVLRLRTIAELQAGQTDKALADVKLSLQLVHSIRTEPFLISHLVRIAMVEITLLPIYEGLAEHQWSDAQLAELDAEVAKLNLLADYSLAMRGETGFQDGIFDYLRRNPEQLSNMTGGYPDRQPPPGWIFIHLMPTGWFYQNQLHCARPMVELILPVADASQQTISPAMVKKADAIIKTQTGRLNAFNVIARMTLPSLGSSAERFAYGQASVDLARVAIALERYRLAHGGYPDSLHALAPQFIARVPHDVIGGGPLHYRLTSDGQFVLYSIGWNETDDGGVVVFMGRNRNPRDEFNSPVDITKGDWVWRYPKK